MVCACLPKVDRCCGCILDLRSACAIIAVLAIVTSPAVSWAVVRHSYVIRMSCFITTNAVRPDVVDITLSNMLSFGFGVNAGLGPSCMDPSKTTTIAPAIRSEPSQEASNFIQSVRWVGWLVLLADLMFVIFSIIFLFRLFKPVSEENQAGIATQFMWSCIIAILLSFSYSMLYVASCIVIGGSFPVFEFLFALVDLLLWLMWIYFIIIINSYINEIQSNQKKRSLREQWYWYYYIKELPYTMGNKLYQYLQFIAGYTFLLTFFWFSVWTYFLIVVNSYSRGMPSSNLAGCAQSRPLHV